MTKELILQSLESLTVYFVITLVLFILTAYLDRFVKESNRITVYIGLILVSFGGFFFLNIILLLIELI